MATLHGITSPVSRHLRGRMRAERVTRERTHQHRYIFGTPGGGAEVSVQWPAEPEVYYLWRYEVINTTTGAVVQSDSVADFRRALDALVEDVAVLREVCFMGVSTKALRRR